MSPTTPSPPRRPSPNPRLAARTRRAVVAGRRSHSAPTGEVSPETVEKPLPDEEIATLERTKFFDRRRGVLVLTAVAVLLAGMSAGTIVGAKRAAEGSPATNAALVDTATTTAITGQITEAVQTVFSFDPKDIQRTSKAAQQLLTGDAIGQYNKLYGEVEKQAPEQQLTMTTTVKSVAVQTINGDRADVLVFADQKAVRAGGQPSVGGAQLRILTQNVDGHWRIGGITVL